MIKQNLKKYYKRHLEISEDSQQITLHDSRFYKRNGDYYPSITTILGIYPKGHHFEQWLKKVGFAADHIVKKSAEEGTIVHELIEKWLLGETLEYLYPDGNPRYPHNVWQMFLNFVDFWETYKPTLIETEIHLFSDELKVAGTCDLIIELNNERWLLDNKTSNQISPTYEIQTAVYGKCFEECYGKKIDRYGTLWLKSNKRKANFDKMCGKGWEVVQPVRSYDENIEIFKLLQQIYKIENPKMVPDTLNIRTTAKREF